MDNFFSSLYEFDFDIVMNKLNLSNKKFFSIHETKMVLFYLTGKKIKKLEIMQKLNEHYSKKKIIEIDKDNLKYLFDKYSQTVNLKDIINSFYNFLRGNNHNITEISLDNFIEKIKSIKPNLSNELITQLYSYIIKENNHINYNNISNIIKSIK